MGARWEPTRQECRPAILEGGARVTGWLAAALAGLSTLVAMAVDVLA